MNVCMINEYIYCICIFSHCFSLDWRTYMNILWWSCWWWVPSSLFCIWNVISWINFNAMKCNLIWSVSESCLSLWLWFNCQSCSVGDPPPDLCFQMHMEEPCFDFLRTKETLGWACSPGPPLTPPPNQSIWTERPWIINRTPEPFDPTGIRCIPVAGTPLEYLATQSLLKRRPQSTGESSLRCLAKPGLTTSQFSLSLRNVWVLPIPYSFCLCVRCCQQQSCV